MKLSLCLLTWNELQGCQHDLPLIERERFEEIYAVDGGSTDGTVEYLQSQGVPVYQQDKPGYNNAYLSAFRRCNGDALVIFQPKATVDPRETLKFRQYFEAGHDLVVSSRIIPGGVNEEDGHFFKPRKWFVVGVAAIARVLWKREGTMIWDVVHGFRGMRKDAFFAIEPLETGLAIDLEMVVRAYRKRLKRVEFPIAERPRSYGDTHFKAFPTGLKVLRYMLYELRRSA